MNCTPCSGTTCPPSFNQRYPLPEDPRVASASTATSSPELRERGY